MKHNDLYYSLINKIIEFHLLKFCSFEYLLAIMDISF